MRNRKGIVLGPLLIFLLALGAPSAIASTKVFACGQSGTYTVNVLTSTVTNSDKCSGLLDIDGSVRYIGPKAFSGNSTITSIKVPSSVLAIDVYAFAYMPNLRSISFSSRLREIRDGAFQERAILENCRYLTV